MTTVQGDLALLLEQAGGRGQPSELEVRVSRRPHNSETSWWRCSAVDLTPGTISRLAGLAPGGAGDGHQGPSHRVGLRPSGGLLARPE